MHTIKYPLTIEESVYRQIQIQAKNKATTVAKLLQDLINKTFKGSDIVVIKAKEEDLRYIPLPKHLQALPVNSPQVQQFLNNSITEEEINTYEPDIHDLSHRYSH